MRLRKLIQGLTNYMEEKMENKTEASEIEKMKQDLVKSAFMIRQYTNEVARLKAIVSYLEGKLDEVSENTKA